MEIITRAEAKARGLKCYFTGKPCKRGHISQRKLGDKTCLECAKLSKPANDAKYYEKNRQKYHLRRSRWHNRARAAYKIIQGVAEHNPELNKLMGELNDLT